ncbi:uncharacterized protein LOC129729377 [Wyeomyia smithii]|uniref:uncharacterized protein LOC129729377 n=1 Tax=Wyeomyia smithii TaxID=174621 RepID=UPI00246803B9|nr:uncharacterized protein LOC129729377 [Wyeomyia smithii]
MSGTFGKTFIFLTDLAWKSRVTLPVLITVGFMILNFRWEVEINIHAERIAIQGVEDGGEGGDGRGGRAGAMAAIDYSMEEAWDTTDSEDDDDEYEESEFEPTDDEEDIDSDNEAGEDSDYYH